MHAYLDHAATAPMPDTVRDSYVAALATVGNPSSTHGHGQHASAVLEGAREEIAAALGCDPAETILTGGGTESINLAIKGLFWARRSAGAGPVVVIGDGEHHATIEAAEWLRDHQGATLATVPLTAEGRLEPAELARVLDAAGPGQVALVTALWANNEVGTVQPVADLALVAHERNVPIHIDAVSALGQIPLDFRSAQIDAMSVSAHKIGGPVGVGALVLGRGCTVEALLHGGSQQRARSGTQNVAGAVGFAAALKRMRADGERDRAHMARLRDRIVDGVRAAVPDAVLRGAYPRSASEPGSSTVPDRVPGNAHFTFPGCQGDSLVFLLDAVGVSASVGSACRAGVAEVSHVLLAMGVPEDEAIGSLRLTVGPETRETEIDAFLAALPDAVERARAAGSSHRNRSGDDR